MTNREFFRSKQLFAVVGVGLAAMIAAVVIELLSQSPNPLPKFVSHFDRPGVVEITYKTTDKRTRKDWVDYKNGREKSLAATKGFPYLLEIRTPRELTSYKSPPDMIVPSTVQKIRATPGNETMMLRALRRASKNELEKVFRANGVAYYKLKPNQRDRSSDIKSLWLGLDEKTGLPAVVIYSIDSGEKDSLSEEVKSIKRLPASSAKTVFTTKEIKPKQLENRDKTRSLGFTAKDLKKFKAFQPYWLGEEIDGAKVDQIISNDEYGEKRLAMYYSKSGVHTFNLTEASIDSEKSKAIWKYLNYDKKLKIGGSLALLVDEASPTLYIKRGGTTIWINGLKYKYSQSNEFIKLVEKNLQRP